MDTSALGIYRIGFLVVIVLIVLDVIFGIASAVKKGSFQWQRMYEFLAKDVIPCVLGLATFILFVYFVVPVIPNIPAPLVSEVVCVIALVMVCIFLVYSIIKSVNEVFAQAPAPAPKA
jgi:uncharacterized membrane protein